MGEGSSLTHVMEALLLSCVLAMDTLIASIAYGSKKITLPLRSGVTLNVICGLLLCAALWLGSLLQPYLPAAITLWISFLILLLLGLSKLLDEATRLWISRWQRRERKEIQFSLFRLQLVLQLYANPMEADWDESQSISPREALWLGLSLSLDGLAVGFGAGVSGITPWLLLLFAVTANFCAIFLGFLLGNKLADRNGFSVSWVGGALLVLLAFSKLIRH